VVKPARAGWFPAALLRNEFPKLASGNPVIKGIGLLEEK